MTAGQYPRRRKNRLSCVRYSENGAYFITICAAAQAWLFWDKQAARLSDTDIPPVGAALRRPPDTDASPVGPPPRRPPECLNRNGLAILHEIDKMDAIYQNIITVDNYVIMPNHIHLLLSIHPENVGGRRNAAPTIPAVINQLKGCVTKAIGFPCWQKSFYDHIVRSEDEYRRIWEYIDNNPYKWQEDRYYVSSSE